MAAEKIIKMRRQLAAAPPLLPAVPMAKKKQQALAFLPVPAVELVSMWGLINAFAVAFTCTVFVVLCIIDPCVPSWMLPPLDELKPDPARDARASAFLLRAILGTVAQAAAATAALALAPSRRRIRRALAYAVLVAAVASHYMFAGAIDIHRIITHPGYPIFVRFNNTAAIFIFAVGDFVCFLALLVGGDE